MKFIFKVILIICLSYLSEIFLPWWSVAIVAFLTNFWLPTKGLNSFLSGLLGVGLLWLVYAWLINTDTEGIVADRIAQLFNVGSSVVMIAITGLVGGLVGGFAALSGSQFRRIFMRDIPKRGYYS